MKPLALEVSRITRRAALGAAAAAISLSLLAGVGTAGAEEGQTLVVAWPNGAEGIDMEYNVSRRSLEVYANVGIRPLRYGAKAVGDVFTSDFDKVLPWAAEKWELSPDYSSITITLRPGILSPTGNELTADDAIWTWERHAALKGSAWSFLKDALNANKTAEAAFKKIDKYTYSITSDGPNFLEEVIQAHNTQTILDSAEYKKHATADDPWSTKWAGSNFASFGPWMVTEYTPGQSWTFERNPNYFDPTAFTGNVTKVINRVVPSSANRVALLQAGSIDIAFDLEGAELKKLESVPGVRVDSLPGNLLQFMGFTFDSKESPALSDLNVRKAIGLALNYDAIVERPYLGYAQQMTSTVAPAYKGYDKVATIWNRKQDLKAAKKLMAASPYPDGFKTTLHHDANQPGAEATAILIKSDLAAIGIDVEIRKLQTGDFSNVAYGTGFPGMFIYTDMAGTPDVNFGAHLWLRPDFCCQPGNYSPPAIGPLFAEAQASPADFDKRVELERQMEDIAINVDPIIVPLQALGFQAASRDNVGGWFWHSLNEMYWETAWKK